MGRETKILLGLLGGLCCGLVAALVVKLTLVRPPEGAGVDVHPPEPSAVTHLTVAPPEYPAETRGDGRGPDASLAPVVTAAAPAGPVTARAESSEEEAPPPPGMDGLPAGDRSVAGDRSIAGEDPLLPGAGAARADGVRLAAAEAPAEDQGSWIGDAPGDGRSSGPAGRAIRVGTAFAVAEGDTWWSIAERAYGDGRWYRPLYAWNKTLDPRLSLRPGTRIVVPTQPELEAAWASLVPQEGRPVASARGTAPANEPPAAREVVVREGDTLLSLAREHLGSASRWRDLHAWNRDRLQPSPGPLSPGMALRLEP